MIATSTGHAEANAFYNSVREAVYCRKVVQDFVFPERVTTGHTSIWGDNQACVELMKHENEKYQRTKHWRMHWAYLHEEREAFKSYYPEKVDGKDNWADMLTKPLAKPLFERIVQALKLCPQ